ncbi:hypothetical protein ACOI1H_19220 [Loktanella sp. DJP18]|uniref:hypothetical protein n=1 Tax=Loktanella sp. DJP18 TaxID=3409788 RepID=UPI003BB71380
MTGQPAGAWSDRIALTRAGWRTEMRFTRNGIASENPHNRACGVWASRSDWHGVIADVYLHHHAILDLDDPDIHQKLTQLWSELRALCVRAVHTFEKDVPCIIIKDGTLDLAVNRYASDLSAEDTRDVFPTEDLPVHLEYAVIWDGNDHLAALVDAARAGLHVEDSLNPWFGRSRMIRDCKDRTWGYRLRLTQRDSGDVKVVFKPVTFSVETLHEDCLRALVVASHASINRLFARFAAGGADDGTTDNALPPGHAARPRQ